ncbi:MAG: hypothetical protein KBA46_08130 [Candidatus Omnitrophica bacterium]|nr:hypothetical protein [Candidatus Omnitrophota bacterium]
MKIGYLLKEYWQYCLRTRKWWFFIFLLLLIGMVPLLHYFNSQFSMLQIYALF